MFLCWSKIEDDGLKLIKAQLKPQSNSFPKVMNFVATKEMISIEF
jgi:hypothetical protein